jgi:hypothetical protein
MVKFCQNYSPAEFPMNCMNPPMQDNAWHHTFALFHTCSGVRRKSSNLE